MNRPLRITALPGDGIGPEVTAAALRVLFAAAEAFDVQVEVEERPVGWASVRAAGTPLTESTLTACLGSDAVFLGAVGDPAAEGAPPGQRPEAGLLRLRKALGCHTNLRPCRVLDPLLGVSPLRPERVRGVDFVIVRELAGGLYYGEPRGRAEGSAVNTLRYGEDEVERVAEAAFRLAASRRGHLVSVDKANVLETSQLWREVVTGVGRRYPTVQLEHRLVDRVAMELVLRPREFDVLLMENLFGDILSDEAAGVAGSLGLLPSASLGGTTPLFEPVHGSAPEIAGEGVANPVGAILSAALLLDHASLGDHPAAGEAARSVERAVEEVLEAGFRTADLAAEGEGVVGTEEFTEAVVSRIGGASDGEAVGMRSLGMARLQGRGP